MNTSSEPRVWETKTTAGGTVWNAYDPASGRILRSASPAEVRIWLEERYVIGMRLSVRKPTDSLWKLRHGK